ncbi:hypothetical protein M8C21_003098 [Ambrosia artemisiifolia]|uniref:Uncharacterized protein n=1 Tax=Ambrosia artemisiifolia TaxID=4212 RepID=A0AAD5GVX6_AMBAR|nr:hypothetical protein M8C21_003098 [Ambrosia artemisiifolia]
MVLSNKKLKQKLRSVLSESLSKTESQPTQPNQSFKELLNSVTQKPKLSKREIRRIKIPSLQPNPDQQNGVVIVKNESEGGDELKKKKKSNKRKREKDVGEEDKGVSEKKSNDNNNNNINKKKKKKIKKKKVVKKEDEEGVKKESEEQDVIEAVQVQVEVQTQTSKEDENTCTKIYVGGIPYYSTVDDIRTMISFRTEAAAKRALDLDGSDMGGLSLKIQPYKATREKKVSDFAPAMVKGYNRIYVGNLSWDMTEDELKKFFSDCSISSVRLGKDKETGEFKGFAHVDFADSLSLTMALKLDQKPLFGRPVRVRCAVPTKSATPGSKVDPTISKNEGNVNDDVARKGKRQTCYDCGEKGHLSSSCPNKKAADVAHTSNEANDVAFDEVEADNVGDVKLKRRTCYECGEKGHLSSLCPNKTAADVAHTYNRIDDVAFDKDEKEVDNIGDGKLKRRTCYECGEKGHLSSACPNKQAADVAISRPETFAPVVVKDNEEVDYNMVNSVSDGKLRRRSCYECGERGHLSSACPKKQAADAANSIKEAKDMEVEKADVAAVGKEVTDNAASSVSEGKLRRRTCYECGERGHLSSLCPKKQAADVVNLVKEANETVYEKADVAVVGKDVSDNAASSISEGKLRRRTCYECGERGHLSSLCPKKQTADVASLSKEGDNMEVEEVKTPAAVSDGKLKRRNCYECGLKGHLSSLCPNK